MVLPCKPTTPNKPLSVGVYVAWSVGVYVAYMVHMNALGMVDVHDNTLPGAQPHRVTGPSLVSD